MTSIDHDPPADPHAVAGDRTHPMRGFGKTLGQCLGFLRALPFLLLYILGKPLLGKTRAFVATSERIAKVPGFLGIYTRWHFYRLTLPHVGRDVSIGFMTVLTKPDATFGDRVYIGRNCNLGLVHLQDQVMVADGVQILSGRHQHGRGLDTDQPMRDQPQRYVPVRVGEGAWLGAGSVVMADVGSNALVAAGGVVTRPVPADTRVGGVPAEPLGGIRGRSFT